MKVTKIDVWGGEIPDSPGGLDDVLGKLGDAGANLECVIARRLDDKPGAGVVLLTPVKGAKAKKAASDAGLKPAADIATLRVEGADAPGRGHRIAQAIAAAGLNLRGASAMAAGRNFVAYFSFDSADDARKAANAIKALAKPKKSPARKK